MKIFSRRLLVGALALLLFTSACNLPSGPTAIPVGTFVPTEQATVTVLPTNTPNDTTPTPFIPITGMDVVSLQCQFCVNDQAHAILIVADFVNFNVANPDSGVSCLTAQVVNGKRILICHGAQLASFTLNICTDPSNCLQFPVTLQTCPLVPQTGLGTLVVTITPLTPIFLTPINTLRPPSSTPKLGTAVPSATPIVSPPPTEATSTPPPPATSTPEPPTQTTPAATQPSTNVITENPTSTSERPSDTPTG